MELTKGNLCICGLKFGLLTIKAYKQTAKCNTENEEKQPNEQQGQRFMENTLDWNRWKHRLKFMFVRRSRVIHEKRKQKEGDHQQKYEGRGRHTPFSFAFSNISKPGSSFCARLAWLKMERIRKDTSKVSAVASYRALKCLINETWITGWSHCCR